MLHAVRCLACAAPLILLAGAALAQTGGQAAPSGAVPKPQAPGVAKDAKAAAEAPAATVAGTFGQWSLVCSEAKTKDAPSCTLVQALVEKETQKMVFRVSVAYGPKGNLG